MEPKVRLLTTVSLLMTHVHLQTYKLQVKLIYSLISSMSWEIQLQPPSPIMPKTSSQHQLLSTVERLSSKLFLQVTPISTLHHKSQKSSQTTKMSYQRPFSVLAHQSPQIQTRQKIMFLRWNSTHHFTLPTLNRLVNSRLQLWMHVIHITLTKLQLWLHQTNQVRLRQSLSQAHGQ